MKTQDDQSTQADKAVEAERNRCIAIMDLYRHEFADAHLAHVWCRARNQIAAGEVPPPPAVVS